MKNDYFETISISEVAKKIQGWRQTNDSPLVLPAQIQARMEALEAIQTYQPPSPTDNNNKKNQ